MISASYGHLRGGHDVASEINVQIVDRSHRSVHESANRDRDPQFFLYLASQSCLGSFVVVDLSARKLPLSRRSFSRRSTAGKNLTIPTEHRRNYFDSRQLGSLFGAQLN